MGRKIVNLKAEDGCGQTQGIRCVQKMFADIVLERIGTGTTRTFVDDDGVSLCRRR